MYDTYIYIQGNIESDSVIYQIHQLWAMGLPRKNNIPHLVPHGLIGRLNCKVSILVLLKAQEGRT